MRSWQAIVVSRTESGRPCPHDSVCGAVDAKPEPVTSALAELQQDDVTDAGKRSDYCRSGGPRKRWLTEILENLWHLEIFAGKSQIG